MSTATDAPMTDPTPDSAAVTEAGRCNCATFGNAGLCPVHTQADYDAATLAARAAEPADGARLRERIMAVLLNGDGDWIARSEVLDLLAATPAPTGGALDAGGTYRLGWVAALAYARDELGDLPAFVAPSGGAAWFEHEVLGVLRAASDDGPPTVEQTAAAMREALRTEDDHG